MPRRYIAELICDRIAAAETYNGEAYNDRQPLEYYLKSKEGLWFVSENTKKDVDITPHPVLYDISVRQSSVYSIIKSYQTSLLVS